MLSTTVGLMMMAGMSSVPNAEFFAEDPKNQKIYQVLLRKMRGFEEDEVAEIAQTVVKSARKNRLDPFLVLGMMQVESSFVRHQISSVGAMGLLQVMPSTGALYARRAGVRWQGPETLFDPVANIRIGTRYLAQLIRMFDGNVDFALASYCHGPGRVRRLMLSEGGVDAYRLRYAGKVRRAWQRIYLQSKRIQIELASAS